MKNAESSALLLDLDCLQEEVTDEVILLRHADLICD
jgi:hypothetical protein